MYVTRSYFSQGDAVCRCAQSLDSSRSWFSSHRSWDVYWCSEQSAVTLASSSGWYIIPKGPWTAAGGFSPSLFIRDFAICHAVPYFCFPPSAFLRVFRLTVLKTQLTAVLHAGSWVIYHSFLNLDLCFSRLSRQCRSSLWYKSVILTVDSLYAEALEAVKSRVALSASSPS
jgi:hypothetical protein